MSFSNNKYRFQNLTVPKKLKKLFSEGRPAKQNRNEKMNNNIKIPCPLAPDCDWESTATPSQEFDQALLLVEQHVQREHRTPADRWAL